MNHTLKIMTVVLTLSLFSYYMMLGVEGGAEVNNDNKITARELHSFVLDKVERRSQLDKLLNYKIIKREC